MRPRCELQNLFILSCPFSHISSTFFLFFCISCKFCILPIRTTFILPFMFAFFFCYFVILLILPFACFIPGLQILVETHVQGFRILRLAPCQSVNFQPCTNEYLSDQKFMCCFKVTQLPICEKRKRESV